MNRIKDPQRLSPNCVSVRGSAKFVIAVYGLVLIKVASHCAIQLPGFLAIVGRDLPVHLDMSYYILPFYILASKAPFSATSLHIFMHQGVFLPWL
jgi:hypothetical protein